MDTQLTDTEIDALIAEPKRLAEDYRQKLRMRPKRGHRERELDLTGDNANQFRVILRESSFNALDFSVILAWLPPKSNAIFKLRRYNGKSHEHTNKIEEERFYDFHIHPATLRYQQLGVKEESFAQATDRYQNFARPLRCMIDDCGFIVPKNDQLELF